jgi:hypothetical protein
MFFSEIHIYINSVLRRKYLPEPWNESDVVPICKKGNKGD